MNNFARYADEISRFLLGTINETSFLIKTIIIH